MTHILGEKMFKCSDRRWYHYQEVPAREEVRVVDQQAHHRIGTGACRDGLGTTWAPLARQQGGPTSMGWALLISKKIHGFRPEIIDYVVGVLREDIF